MADPVYPYDKDLYSRAYLNCYQRQSLVGLGESVPDAPLLFAGALVSTDEIHRQIVLEGKPRYDFDSPVLDPEALALIGVTARQTPAADYAEARPLLLEAVRENGFVLPVIDVFYLPHCVEHRKQHVVHTIMLTGLGDGHWSFVDDNPASVLCEYRFPEQVVADAFDNGELRQVRTFTTAGYDPAEASAGTAAAFAARLESYTDTHAVLEGAADLLGSLWVAPSRAITLLGDVFTVHLGSRTCLREYVRRQLPDPETDALLAAAVGRSAGLRSRLLVGAVTGLVDVPALAAEALALKETEERLLDRLRAEVLQRL